MSATTTTPTSTIPEVPPESLAAGGITPLVTGVVAVGVPATEIDAVQPPVLSPTKLSLISSTSSPACGATTVLPTPISKRTPSPIRPTSDQQLSPGAGQALLTACSDAAPVHAVPHGIPLGARSAMRPVPKWMRPVAVIRTDCPLRRTTPVLVTTWVARKGTTTGEPGTAEAGAPGSKAPATPATISSAPSFHRAPR